MAGFHGKRLILPTRSSPILPERRHPQSALHGRRKGKKLRFYQARLMETALPQIALDVASAIVDPKALFGKQVSDVWLEIGFGGGEHLVNQAVSNPETGFFGCEPFINGAAKLLTAIHEIPLPNVRVHVGDAVELIDCLPDASISRIYLLYPDPWPKRRQRKRRFVSDSMLIHLARILAPGGEFRFATDIDDYAGWVLSRILKCPDFSWSPDTSDSWTNPWEGWTETRYEAKAIREGRPRAYFRFIRI